MLGWIKKRVGRDEKGGASDALGTGSFARRGSSAAGPSSQDGHMLLDEAQAAQAEEISRLAVRLERDIQRILKAAKDLPPEASGIRWQGTDELLSLLAGAPRPTVELVGRPAATAQSDVCDKEGVRGAVAAATAEPAVDLCEALLSYKSHPYFARLCVEASLPSNLVHCLRIMRVVEFETAKGASGAASVPSQKFGWADEDLDLAGDGLPKRSEAEGWEEGISCLTIVATQRLTSLLVILVGSGEPGLAEQVKPHLRRLLSLAVSSSPRNGIHIQTSAQVVISALCRGGLTGAAVWPLHHNKVMPDLVDELRHLAGLNVTALSCSQPGVPTPSSSGSGTTNLPSTRSSGGGIMQRLSRSSPRSPTHFGRATSAAGGADAAAGVEVCELTGPEAEAAGMWVTALEATVDILRYGSALVPPLLSAFEQAEGYETILAMVQGTAQCRLAKMLELVCLLATAQAEKAQGLSSGAPSPPDDEAFAANPRAFAILKLLLLQHTPVMARICAEGGAAMSSSSVVMPPRVQPSVVVVEMGDQEELDMGPDEAISLVAQSSVADRLSWREQPSDALLEDDAYRMQLLEAVLNLYSSHVGNYSALEPRSHFVSFSIAALPLYGRPDLKSLVLKTLEVVCVMFTDVKPTEALRSVTTTFRACLLAALELVRVCVDEVGGADEVRLANAEALVQDADALWGMLEKLLQFDARKFADILASLGLFDDVLSPLLAKTKSLGPPEGPEGGMSSAPSRLASRILQLQCQMMSALLAVSPRLCRLARGLDLLGFVHLVIETYPAEDAKVALKVLESAAACSPEGVGADLAFLLEMVQKTQARTDRQRQTLALIGTRNILACGHAQAKDAWRDGSGFEASVAAISSLDGAFEDCGAVVSEHHQALFGVIRASLAVLTTALSTVSDPRSSTDRLKGHPPNRRYMRQRIRYKTLACCLLNSGAPSCPPLSLPMVNLLFQMVTEQPGICIRTQDGSSAPYADPNPRGADEMHRIICNADAALVLLHLLPSLDEKLGASVVQALIAMVRTGGYAEMQAMARAGLLRVITSELISTGLAHTHPSGSSSSLASTSVKSTLQAGSLEELLIIPSSSAHIGAFEDEDELSASGYALPDLLHSRRGMGSRAVSAEVENLVLQLLMVTVSHRMRPPELALLIRCVTLPLFLSDGGMLAPPTLWPAVPLESLLPVGAHSCTVPPASLRLDDFTAAERQWGRLEVLSSMARVAGEGPVSFIRLGGASTTDMSAVCEAVNRAIAAGAKAGAALTRAMISEASQEGLKLVHAPSLDSANAYFSTGTVSLPGSAAGVVSLGSAWPGSNGYAFACWARFNSLAGAGGTQPSTLKSWLNESATEAGLPAPPPESAAPPANAADGPFILFQGHHAGRQILWLTTLASHDGLAYISLYFDVLALTLCVRCSTEPKAELRSPALHAVAAAPQSAWHHIALSHARVKSGRRLLSSRDELTLLVDGTEVAKFHVDMPVLMREGDPHPASFFGLPHPLAFREPSVGQTAAPTWHMGPALVLNERLDVKAVSSMFAVGPSYTGMFTGERARAASSATLGTCLLRRLMLLGGRSGTQAVGGDISNVLALRHLSNMDGVFNSVDRVQLQEMVDRTFMRESFYDVLSQDSVALFVCAKFAESASEGGLSSGTDVSMSRWGPAGKGIREGTWKTRFPAPSLITSWLPQSGGSAGAAVYGGSSGEGAVIPEPLPVALEALGGPGVLLPLVLRAQTEKALCQVLGLIHAAVRGSEANLSFMLSGEGYLMLANLLREKRQCLGPSVVSACFSMAVDATPSGSRTGDDAAQPAAEASAGVCQAWGWEASLISMSSEEISRAMAGDAPARNAWGSKSDFLLLTDSSALKHLVMNHQVWGLRSTTLMSAVLQRLNALVSPHNAASYCRFNARILHRIGVFRWVLHLMLEAAEGASDTRELGAQGDPHTTLRPTAAAAAAGLDTRNSFLALCALLLQRVLAIVAVQRDFDRVVGATISTLADGGSRGYFAPGSDPRARTCEDALMAAGLLPGVGSSGTVMLTGQGLVRLYLLRLLFEVIALPGGLHEAGGARMMEGEILIGGDPHALLRPLLVMDGRVQPPIVPYRGRSNLFKSVAHRTLKPEWFVSLLEAGSEEASIAAVLRLLCHMVQVIEVAFRDAEGWKYVSSCICRHSASLPVILPVLAILLDVPIAQLPSSIGSLALASLSSCFEAAPGPKAVTNVGTTCLADVLLPCVSRNFVIMQAAEGGGDSGDAPRARTVNLFVMSLLQQSYMKHSTFRRLCLTPNSVEALTDCAATGWYVRPSTVAEGAEGDATQYRGQDVMLLVQPLVRDIVIYGVPAGTGAFQTMSRMMTAHAGSPHRQEGYQCALLSAIEVVCTEALSLVHLSPLQSHSAARRIENAVGAAGAAASCTASSAIAGVLPCAAAFHLCFAVLKHIDELTSAAHHPNLSACAISVKGDSIVACRLTAVVALRSTAAEAALASDNKSASGGPLLEVLAALDKGVTLLLPMNPLASGAESGQGHAPSKAGSVSTTGMMSLLGKISSGASLPLDLAGNPSPPSNSPASGPEPSSPSSAAAGDLKTKGHIRLKSSIYDISGNLVPPLPNPSSPVGKNSSSLSRGIWDSVSSAPRHARDQSSLSVKSSAASEGLDSAASLGTLLARHTSSSSALLVSGLLAELLPLALSDNPTVSRLAAAAASVVVAGQRQSVLELAGPETAAGLDLMVRAALGDGKDEGLTAFRVWMEAASPESLAPFANTAMRILPEAAEGILPLRAGHRPAHGAAGRSIKRADQIAKTYGRVALSHRRWVWSGVDAMAASSWKWKNIIRQQHGEYSIWEGGIFCRLMAAGIWGPNFSSSTPPVAAYLVKWKLDLREGHERTRRRLVRNSRFYETYDVERSSRGQADEFLLVEEPFDAPLSLSLSLHTSISDALPALFEGEEGIPDLTSLIRDVSKQVATKRGEKHSSVFDEEDLDSSDAILSDVEEEDGEGEEGPGRTRSTEEEEEEAKGDEGEAQDGTEKREESIQNLLGRANSRRKDDDDDDDEEDDEDGGGPTSPSIREGAEGGEGTGAAGPEAMASSGAGVFSNVHDIAWSDNEVFVGLIEPEDWPLQAIYNAQRSIGLEVRQCVLVLCKNAVHIVDGFEKVIPARKSSINDPLMGLRRVREPRPPAFGGSSKERGGGKPATASSARFKVALRRESTVSIPDGARVATKSVAKADLLEDEQANGMLESQVSDELEIFHHVGVTRMHNDQILAVFKRRYQLRDVALELFDTDGRSVLVSLDTQELQEQVLAAILRRSLPSSLFTRSKLRFKLSKASTDVQARQTYRRFIQSLRVGYTQRWQNGQVSNFEYLMALNTLAGRSFNDITQYPVFPWVIQDYTSEELDLTDPKTYRDLSKPMGALGEARAAQFTERYAAVVESAAPGEESDPPPFHYGTHYSCAGYILYYLLRLEPFSRLALSLQGGKFDKPDRLFRDIQSSWESASSENLQDVRELIPEFFYLPEFLQNFNRFDFGITQRGLPVHHVVLPPWAKGDPREFVMIQRRALESDYVSRHLHSWIDLIFGYKQRGEEAVLAQNVFVHLTYEGEVDLDAIEDPMLREATLAQIHNFGQTPSRLFSRPHPRRETPTVLKGDSLDLAAIAWREPGTPPLCIVGAPEHIAMKPVAVAGAVGPAGTREAPISDAVYDRDRDRVVAVSSGALLWRRSSDVYIRYGGMAAPSGVSFHSVAAIAGARAGSTERALSCHSHLHDGEVTAAACAPDGRLLITGGTDAAVRVWTVLLVSGVGVGPKTRSLKLMGVLAGHSSSIVCLDVCVSNGLLVSGGKDARVMVWDLARCSFVRELPGHRVAISSVSINPTNGNMVTLSGPELRVWTVNGDVLARCSVMSVRRSLPTCAVATACADWQDGVAAVTGHANGDVSLWGIAWGGKGKDAAARRNSSTLERQSSFDDGNADPREDEDVLGGLLASRHSQPRGLTLLRVLSNAHSRSITCLRVCGSTPGSQRELLAGDEKGVVSRWQTIRLVDLTSDELGQLFPRRNQKEEEVVTGASTSLPLGPLSSNATAL